MQQRAAGRGSRRGPTAVREMPSAFGAGQRFAPERQSFVLTAWRLEENRTQIADRPRSSSQLCRVPKAMLQRGNEPRKRIGRGGNVFHTPFECVRNSLLSGRKSLRRRGGA